MKVSPASDIVGIASSFGIASHQYREIKRDEDAYEIAHRWPMLAELHGLAPEPVEEHALTAAAAAMEATAEAGPATSSPAWEKSGLKVVTATSQNAEAEQQPPSSSVPIAA